MDRSAGTRLSSSYGQHSPDPERSGYQGGGITEKVRELFLAALEDGKLRSYVILNFKPSKLGRPVVSWSNEEWEALVKKFAFFRTMLTQASKKTRFYNNKKISGYLYADSALWGELEDKLAAKILEDYRRG